LLAYLQGISSPPQAIPNSRDEGQDFPSDTKHDAASRRSKEVTAQKTPVSQQPSNNSPHVQSDTKHDAASRRSKEVTARKTPVSQQPSNNSPHVPFGTQGDTFQVGSNLVKKKQLREKKANAALNFAMSSPRDTEGIELLRQIFSEESDHELDGIHTNYLHGNSSNAAYVAEATYVAEVRAAKQKAKRFQSREGRIDHANRAVRPDDLVTPAQGASNCLKTKDRSDLPKNAETEEITELL
jgi:hypothetical protein